jgi:3-carboxy-cis,cis-muconate cycloisomerase
LFDALFVPPDVLAATSDDAFVAAMVEAEVALARAQGRELDPGGPFDAAELMREGRAVANPAEPLVRRLRAVDARAHEGATSQDIVDTALMLVAKGARGLVLDYADAVAQHCARLADEHRGTAMAARTLLQQAVPTTFGLKAAVWLSGVVEARRRLAAVELAAQLGGAAGTLDEPGWVRRYAAELGLAEPALPWHSNRVRVAELVDALALVAGACGKIARDVILLAQTEVAEVRAPSGGSTAMAHKRNPALAVVAVAAARQVTGRVDLLGEHERAAGVWQAEWPVVANALAYAGGAAAATRDTLAGLEVDAERMRANISPELAGYPPAGDVFVDRALERYGQA